MSQPVKKIPTLCLWCGKEFKTHMCDIRRGGGKYCSHKCYSDSNKGLRTSPRVNCTCTVCSKEFDLTQWEVDNGQGKYCSRTCQTEDQKRQVEKTCLFCSKTFLVRPSDIKKRKGNCQYCSKICFKKSRIPLPNRVCKNCNKDFYVEPSQIQRGRGIFCSVQCWRKGTHSTTIEIACYDKFCKLGLIPEVDFIFQYRIPKTPYTPDFFFPALNLIIDVFGDYWHTKSNVIERDKKRKDIIESRGIKLIVWWEHEIRSDVNFLVSRDLLPILFAT